MEKKCYVCGVSLMVYPFAGAALMLTRWAFFMPLTYHRYRIAVAVRRLFCPDE